MKPLYSVKFFPGNKKIQIVEGTSLIFAALKAGITINTPCGGKGTCGKCRVIISPPPSPTPQEKKIFTREELKKGWRLSCQHSVHSNLNVEIPLSSRYFPQVILTEIQKGKISLTPSRITSLKFFSPSFCRAYSIRDITSSP